MLIQDIKKGMLLSQWGSKMTDEQRATTDGDQPMTYHIKIRGHLGWQWLDWFEGFSVTLEEDGSTLLTGPIIDQTALHGVLKKVRDLGLALLSVSSV